jgi:hypothetical protein
MLGLFALRMFYHIIDFYVCFSIFLHVAGKGRGVARAAVKLLLLDLHVSV